MTRIPKRDNQFGDGLVFGIAEADAKLYAPRFPTGKSPWFGLAISLLCHQLLSNVPSPSLHVSSVYKSVKDAETG